MHHINNLWHYMFDYIIYKVLIYNDFISMSCMYVVYWVIMSTTYYNCLALCKLKTHYKIYTYIKCKAETQYKKA